jgi:hypothetical protein
MDIPIGPSGLEGLGVNPSGLNIGQQAHLDPANSEFSMDLKDSHRAVRAKKMYAHLDSLTNAFNSFVDQGKLSLEEQTKFSGIIKEMRSRLDSKGTPHGDSNGDTYEKVQRLIAKSRSVSTSILDRETNEFNDFNTAGFFNVDNENEDSSTSSFGKSLAFQKFKELESLTQNENLSSIFNPSEINEVNDFVGFRKEVFDMQQRLEL